VANIAVESISIYPIKSSSGIQLSTSWVEELGLSFDRRFIVADEHGEMFTARTQPRLCLIQANLTANGINISAPGMPNLLIEYAKFSSQYQNVNVWGTDINGQQGIEEYNQWFSRYIEQPCKLLFFGEKSERFVKDKKSQVGFADGYPLLLISKQSLALLNDKLAKKNNVSMAQFRPNIVVDVSNGFDEDSWKVIRIGEVEFEVTSPCSRCIFTTINPETSIINPYQEPLKTLKSFRQVESGDVMFGQNMIALSEGQIKQGDKVEVLERKSPPVFISTQTTKKKAATTSAPAKVNKKPNINFSSWNKEIVGNNKKTVLEQGEDAGLIIPYSCRGGMCGHCKVKLESGSVKQLATDGLSDQDKENGYILACSSVPTSDIEITKAPRIMARP